MPWHFDNQVNRNEMEVKVIIVCFLSFTTKLSLALKMNRTSISALTVPSSTVEL